MNELIHDATLYEDIPDSVGRREREMEVYRLLKSLEIPFQRMDHEPMATIEACRGVDEILGIHMCKNLFLCNSQKTVFYLLLMPGEKKFKTKELSKQIGSARLSFAPEEFMEEYLHISPGAVSVMGLMNDKENHVNLLIDEDVLKEEFLGCHPCVNTASLRLRTKDVLSKFLPFVGHTYRTVHLDGDDSMSASA
ncbi:MAG: prolyl-tRNA synthetase associated domain-containing protein [Lachnospiraceae bacterium]|nr:prolyl-tRNA synthetase associated domain-containing protein [Lachnospiraceae bacterium]